MRNRKLFKVVVVSALVLFGGFVAFLGYTYWQTSPSKLYVTNITDRSASISWVSNEATTGVVIVKEGNYMLPLKLTTNGSTRAGFDDRDRARAELEASEQTAENLADGTAATADDVQTDVTIKNYGEYYVHHATITNLKPETEYDFMVGNGWFFHKEKSVVGGSDKFTTFAQLDQLATPNPSYGKVVLPGEGDDYESSTDSVLYMRVDFGGNKVSQVLSSVTAENGSWYIDLGNARDEFGNEVGEVTEDLNEKVWVEGGPNGMVEEFDNPTSLDAPMQILFLETDEVEARAPFDFLAGEVNAECCEAFTCVDADGTTVASYGGDDDFGGGSCETRKTGICPSGSSPVGGAKCGDTSSTPGAPSQPGGSPTAPAGACSSPQSGNCHNKYNTSIQIGSNPYNACTCTFLDSSNPALCGCHYIPSTDTISFQS
ncbi:MAG: fibronectin type III domain-containing protein [Candidatus Dojkabacteria bacterium]|nr:MAG: fibronectin type III domain-containing protein [Candidatus Dojkabacteria bacterium]